MSNAEKHIVVIGAGPGGYSAAFYAADLGFKVTLIDRQARRGGTCLLRGCIPSKGLLHVASVINETQHAASWGIRFEPPDIELDQLRNWKDGYVEKLSSGIDALAKARKIEVLEAEASFENENVLILSEAGGTRELPFDHCIIATGSRPVMPKIFDLKDERIWDSTDALALPFLPGKLLVIGAGYIGLEMACVYQALGSDVTVVDVATQMLAMADKDLVRPLKKKLDERMTIHLGTSVQSLQAMDAGIEAKFDGDSPGPHPFDAVLVATGRRPVTDSLGLDQASIHTDDRGFIRVDGQGRARANVWAIGDVAGEPMLAHKASADTRVAIDAIAENENPGLGAIPAVIFTDPEMAWVGLTESQAREKGIKVAASRLPWAALGKALSQDAGEGLTKLIFDPESGKLLGAGVVGPSAGDLISQATLALSQGLSAEDFSRSIFPHPTLSESLLESAEAFLGTATHLYRPKRP